MPGAQKRESGGALNLVIALNQLGQVDRSTSTASWNSLLCFPRMGNNTEDTSKSIYHHIHTCSSQPVILYLNNVLRQIVMSQERLIQRHFYKMGCYFCQRRNINIFTIELYFFQTNYAFLNPMILLSVGGRFLHLPHSWICGLACMLPACSRISFHTNHVRGAPRSAQSETDINRIDICEGE